jgi:hypothetical protein
MRPRVYCSDLCSQVAIFVRYFQRVRNDGRWGHLEVQEAMSMQLAHIAGGGYDKSGRVLSAEVRDQILTRDRGLCRKCGQPGTEIDHIAGSSGDLENLQLLCRDCHREKTQSTMVPASPDVVASVYHAIQERALEIPNRQPCDLADWNYRWWVRDEGEVSGELRATWEEWLRGPG